MSKQTEQTSFCDLPCLLKKSQNKRGNLQAKCFTIFQPKDRDVLQLSIYFLKRLQYVWMSLCKLLIDMGLRRKRQDFLRMCVHSMFMTCMLNTSNRLDLEYLQPHTEAFHDILLLEAKQRCTLWGNNKMNCPEPIPVRWNVIRIHYCGIKKKQIPCTKNQLKVCSLLPVISTCLKAILRHRKSTKSFPTFAA